MSPSDFAQARVPPSFGPSILFVALGVAACLLSGYEVLLRSRGVEPSHFDTPSLWSLIHLEAAGESGPAVVIGSSRTQVAVDPTLLGERLRRPAFQLSINGGSPFPILHHFASSHDAPRAELLVVEFTPRRFATEDREARGKAAAYLAYLRTQAWIAPAEEAARRWLADRAAVLAPAASLPSLLQDLAKARLPETPELHLHRHRQIEMRYRAETRERWSRRAGRALRSRPLLGTDGLEARWRDMDTDLRSLAHKGARVVFVRPPSCGGTLAAERERVPRSDLFDVLAARWPGTTWLHFEDLPPPAAPYECVDGSHLTPASARAFGEALANWLETRT